MKAINKRINELVKHAGISHEVIADFTGINLQRFNKIASGASRPTYGEVVQLARVLGVTAEEIVDGRGHLHRVRDKTDIH